MKAIYKGHKFSIVWNIINRSTEKPFDFTGLNVSVGLYSDSCRVPLKTYNIENGTITAQIEPNTLPTGVYNLMCRYASKKEQAYCVYRNAFQITSRQYIGTDVETINLTSVVSHIDSVPEEELPKECQLIAEELFGDKFRLPQLTADRAIADEHGNRIPDTYVTRRMVEGHIKQIYNQQFNENPPLIMEGYITPEMLSEETREMLEATGQEITNLPDGEDLQSIHGVLKLANKKHNPNSYSGLGRQYLRKNIVAGVNVLTQSMIQWPNTIYIIQYDYDLQGAEITIPEGCVLDFQGGSLSNGSIVGNKTIVESPYNPNKCIIDNVLVKGSLSGNFFVSYINTNLLPKENAKALASLTKAVFGGNGNIIWDVPVIKMEIYGEYPGITIQNKVNDFNNTTFEVLNKSHLCYLFAKKETTFTTLEATSISDAVANNVFKRKTGILRIDDKTPFAERYGYGYSNYRRDFLLVQDNKLLYEPIATYDDGDSNPVFSYIIPDHSITIKNINFIRDEESSKKTLFCNILGEKDLTIENVRIETNNPFENADECIYLLNIFNLKLSNIQINGTYSTTLSFGYGIELNGVSKVTIDNLICSANWGVVGTNNINGVVVRDSILDRWDCHCYSKDFIFENCKFYNLYASSSYHTGYIHYKNCDLTNFRPLLNDESYSINKNFQLILEGCVLHNCTRLMNNYLKPKVSNRRRLIAKDEIPDLYVKNCIFDNPINTYIYPCNLFEITPVNRGIISFENCKFLGLRNVISFSSTTTNLDINITNVDFNPVYQYYAYDEFRHIIINSIDAKVNISNSKFCFYYGIVNNTNDIRVHIEDSIVYNARFKDIELDKRYTFDRCTLILDCLDESETKVYVPFSIYNDCHFKKRTNTETCNIGWFQRGPVFNCCTFEDGVLVGDNDINNVSSLLYINLPYIRVVRPLDREKLNYLKQCGINGTYKCYVSDEGFRYVIDGVEVSKEEYYK